MYVVEHITCEVKRTIQACTTLIGYRTSALLSETANNSLCTMRAYMYVIFHVTYRDYEWLERVGNVGGAQKKLL